MLTQDLRQTIHCLHKSGKSNHEISRLLGICRNTVKKVLAEGISVPIVGRKKRGVDILPVLGELFNRCRGNAVRIKEVLQGEYGIHLGYTTLKDTIQRAGLREPVRRFGEYGFGPGEEMQHDTSPHKVVIEKKEVKAQCASLILGYSRKLFMQYYPCFTRFEAKTFLSEAIGFMGGSCRRCIIDNTSVLLAAGSGADAVVSPEMQTFERLYGFQFQAHRIRDANRKGKIERPFFYIETNFLAGRTFKDWADLNHQAKEWCLMVNQRGKRALGMISPDAAFIQEKPHLVSLPEVPPPIYEHCQRLVDSQGYVNLDTNRYSAPEKFIGKALDVYKYPDVVRFFYHHQEIAVHPRLSGKRYHYSRLQEHHSRRHASLRKEAAQKTEESLRGHDPVLDQYVDALKKRVRGSGHKPLNRLLNLKRTYPPEAFNCAIRKACHYGLYDLNRLEELIIKSVAGDYFNLHAEE
jgi:transposase